MHAVQSRKTNDQNRHKELQDILGDKKEGFINLKESHHYQHSSLQSTNSKSFDIDKVDIQLLNEVIE